jgi:Fe-S cluster biogenesis protein NfuA
MTMIEKVMLNRNDFIIPNCLFKKQVSNMSETIEKRVQNAIDEIRPQIQADGGDVELVAVGNDSVKVRLVGHCAGCPMAAMTLKNGVEALIKQRVPEIKKVEAVQ